MPAKPALIRALAPAALILLLGLGTRPAPAAKASLPTILLYPATPGDVAALVDLRTRLRLDGRVEVLTYDPESAAIQRASAEDSHPEWLVSAPASDEGRMVLARALGASFYAVVSPGRATDSTHVELVETAPAARSFDWTGTNRQFGVRAMESQVADSIAHPADYSTVADTSPSSTVALVPAPSVVASAPSVVASAPSVVASAPTAAPIIIALPNSVPPVSAPPLPLIKTSPTPLPLPVQVAHTLPVPVILPPVVSPPVIALEPPKMTVVPVPKVTAAVPVPPLVVAPVSSPQRNTLPPPMPNPPKVVSQPLPVVAETLPNRAVQMAALPKPALPVPLSALPLPPPPEAPAPQTIAPVIVKKPALKAEDMSAVQPLLERGDSALDGGDAVGAIALYRQAVNGAPLSIVPRLKLAQAYQKDGLNDRALDEARRALEIAPDSEPVQQFLSDLDQQTGTTAGTLIRDRAALERSPNDPAAHAALADTLWNNGDLGGAEAEYKAAQALAPEGSHVADAQLAQLYAAEARYDDCLALLSTSGRGGYALAIQIVKNRAETLSSTLSASRDVFAAGKSTREQFYDDAKKLSAEAQALAEFVAAVKPPTVYKLSHLHRMLSTNLLAQETATLVTCIETGDSKQNDDISRLERAADTEMLTAQATEERLGLWKQSTEK